jgi:beta-lactamase class A
LANYLSAFWARKQKRTLRELCELMITASSNLAMNLQIEKLGVENMRATTSSARMG